LPFRQLERLGRQGPQRRPVELLEQAGARARPLLEGAVVELRQQLAHRGVEVGQAVKAPVRDWFGKASAKVQLLAPSTATKIDAGAAAPLTGSKTGIVAPAQSVNAFPPGRWFWRKTNSPRSSQRRKR